MTLMLHPIIFGIVTFFSTVLGGLFAARYRANIGVLAGFASGVLISVPLFDLLPETLNLALEARIPVANVMHVTALGFIFLYVLERYVSFYRVRKSDTFDNARPPIGGLFGTTELSVHSFMDGVAMGVGFQLDFHVGIIVAVAVICHDFSDGLNAITIMLDSGNTLETSMKMLLLDAATPMVGIIFTMFIKISAQYLILILPFFAGGFLYLGASDLLPGTHGRKPSLASLVSSLTGFLLIFILTVVLDI
jgi:zinc transporter ZupT